MGLFGNKTAKVLSKAMKQEVEAQVGYRDGFHTHPTKIVGIYKDKFIMLGFAERLREFSLELYIREFNQSCSVAVKAINHDLKGRLLYHCGIPEAMLPMRKRQENFFIYPKGKMNLNIEKDDGNLLTVPVFIWSINKEGISLVNHTGLSYNPDYEFFLSTFSVGQAQSKTDLKVASTVEKQYGKDTLSLLNCTFCGEPENMEMVMQKAKRLDRLG